MSGDVDRVLTTRELARIVRARGIAFDGLPEGELDNPLGESNRSGPDLRRIRRRHGSESWLASAAASAVAANRSLWIRSSCKKRMEAVYAIDRHAARRSSHQNQHVQRPYATELEAPNSAAAHKLLHTSYAVRGSGRLLLMRFLDAVDPKGCRGGGAAVPHRGPRRKQLAAAPVRPVVLHRIVPRMNQRQLCFATMTGPPGAAARPYLA